MAPVAGAETVDQPSHSRKRRRTENLEGGPGQSSGFRFLHRIHINWSRAECSRPTIMRNDGPSRLALDPTSAPRKASCTYNSRFFIESKNTEGLCAISW
jgi:hypothetical protein